VSFVAEAHESAQLLVRLFSALVAVTGWFFRNTAEISAEAYVSERHHAVERVAARREPIDTLHIWRSGHIMGPRKTREVRTRARRVGGSTPGCFSEPVVAAQRLSCSPPPKPCPLQCARRPKCIRQSGVIRAARNSVSINLGRGVPVTVVARTRSRLGASQR